MRALALLACTGLLACGNDDVSPPKFMVRFRVTTDTEEAVSGANISLGGRPVGSTTERGELVVAVVAPEGEALELAVDCPDALSDPGDLPPLVLFDARTVTANASASPMTRELVCRRTSRELAIVVHTAKHAGLPVVVDGAALTETNADGNAHLVITRAVAIELVHVELDTSRFPALSPKNPGRALRVEGDELLVFAPELSLTTPRRRRAPGTRRAAIPYRLD